ncbi:tRNA G18 (ribose-2'-O)-methylase SpoU [Arcanobacterium wilhelmae]|uniref:tRNA G18 (Ribose-2'-O)-methylase SpoU n=1 Tax=Arcanobacterium wilhelmae TaxID=1803177 RepID=A0ABT9NAG6_9ACTO|nr:TrmH family RNA methyltransferase [Arcanobacterium wilhelmae]MDP9800681.1 tRNA G18 (ribose-2'-O)-methylase SpoU [Arcanobacterium wilhelmae]WFN90081.1 TrmH family RNA methyltransferase [Arcanobacterium wilhelmae]
MNTTPNPNEAPTPAAEASEASGGTDVEPLRFDFNKEVLVGVGPWEGPLPNDPRFDPELLANGDRRNVIDKYRYWSVEAIKADLDLSRSALHIAIENLAHDLNIGSIVRTGNAFNVAGVHIVGKKRWNRRGALVTDRYMDVHNHPDAASLGEWARDAGYTVVAVDNTAGSTPLQATALPEKCVLVFGQESTGLSEELQALAELKVFIPQFGSTRSMNVAAAAAVVQYEWMRQHRL